MKQDQEKQAKDNWHKEQASSLITQARAHDGIQKLQQSNQRQKKKPNCGEAQLRSRQQAPATKPGFEPRFPAIKPIAVLRAFQCALLGPFKAGIQPQRILEKLRGAVAISIQKQ